jgi:hypothetical protein
LDWAGSCGLLERYGVLRTNKCARSGMIAWSVWAELDWACFSYKSFLLVLGNGISQKWKYFQFYTSKSGCIRPYLYYI